MQKLKNVNDVVLVLGGSAEAGRALHVGLTAISNWRARNKIPANQYIAVGTLLAGRDYQADAKIFAFKKKKRRK